jgi:hypothetical protein
VGDVLDFHGRLGFESGADQHLIGERHPAAASAKPGGEFSGVARLGGVFNRSQRRFGRGA